MTFNEARLEDRYRLAEAGRESEIKVPCELRYKVFPKRDTALRNQREHCCYKQILGYGLMKVKTILENVQRFGVQGSKVQRRLSYETPPTRDS